MRERMRAWLVIAMATTSVAGCERGAPAAVARPATSAPPRTRVAPAVEQVKDWTNPKRVAPIGRGRNPFKLDSEVRSDGRSVPIAPDVAVDSLPELPLPVPGADLRLIGIVGSDSPDGRFTAIVTVGNDLIFARAGDTIASRYHVVAVSEDALDVIDAIGNQPRRLSLR
jgi:ABC-type Fe3+-hydroxamate transport system substrate-binding protein